MSLNHVQKDFTDLVFGDVSAVQNPPEHFANLFDSGAIDITHRLSIYRNHVIGTLSGVIVKTFPLVKALVGEEFLTHAAKLFVMQNPPKQACLDQYGSDFSAFLKTYEPTKSLAYLPDMARLDWAMNEVECAKDDQALKRNALVNIPEEDLSNICFTFRYGVRLIESDYALDKIYTLCQDETADQNNIGDVAQRSFILVTRQDFVPKIIRLDESEFMLLKNLLEGETLGAALDHIFDKDPDFNFAEFLQNHMGFGIFKSIEIKT